MKQIRSLAFGLFTASLIGCGPPMANQQATQTPAPAPPVAPPPATRVAEVGVGIKGKSLENEQGVGRAIAQPAITLFRVRERVVFEIQLPQALQLFNASEGRFPKSHEEFMEKIVNANKIPLPQLPPGQVYKFHTDDNQLWVEPEAAPPASP